MFSTMLRFTLGSDEKCKHYQTSQAIRKKEMEDAHRVVQSMIQKKDDFKCLSDGVCLHRSKVSEMKKFCGHPNKRFNASHDLSFELSISFTVNPAEHLLLSTWRWGAKWKGQCFKYMQHCKLLVNQAKPQSENLCKTHPCKNNLKPFLSNRKSIHFGAPFSWPT